MKLGTLNVVFTLAAVSAPPAAATPVSFEIVVTSALLSVPRLRVAVSWSSVTVAPGLNVKFRPPSANDPRVGAVVTVAAVPTPYRFCSTVACAFLTPDDAAVTVITRPMPRARPREMKMAWRIRRRSSRRRYVKNMRTPLPNPGPPGAGRTEPSAAPHLH